jgi:ubiquinol-cytochrome c reductase cytochrome c1 subunit
VNNLVFPDVAMPNVLETLQGMQVPIFKETEEKINGKTRKVKVVAHLALESHGSMTEAQFDSAVNDLVNFLAFAAAPETVQRHYIGYWVIGFLIILAIITYLLKREYWQDVKNK